MKRMHGILTTTRPLSDGTRLTREDLEIQAQSVRQNYVPINMEHDIRTPPVGRVTDARVVLLEDGEYALTGTTELFTSDNEDGTHEDFSGDGRTILLSTDEIETFKIVYDQSFDTSGDTDFIEEVTRLSGSDGNKSETVKCSIEPISVLLIAAGVFVAGNVASGFLQKMGADSYDGLRKVLGKFYHNKNSQPAEPPKLRENMIDFQFAVLSDGRLLEVHILLSNPTQDQINSLFSEGLHKLDMMLQAMPPQLVAREPVQLVFEYRDGQPEFSYGVRKDAVPFVSVRPNDAESNDQIHHDRQTPDRRSLPVKTSQPEQRA